MLGCDRIWMCLVEIRGATLFQAQCLTVQVTGTWNAVEGGHDGLRECVSHGCFDDIEGPHLIPLIVSIDESQVDVNVGDTETSSMLCRRSCNR